MSRIQKLTVKDLENNNNYQFAIPRSFQRGYRWRADNEVAKLLKDINNSSSAYSLQPLILREKDAATGKYDVVDGQQRLTTILLILGDNSQFSDFSHDAIDKAYLEKAKDQIERFKDAHGPEFMEKVRDAFFISYIVDGDEDEVRRIFTRVNEGKIPLSSAELLKAWFFTSLSTMDVREKWKEMETMLEEDSFFYFLNPEPESPRYFATRMDYLLELAEIIISKEKRVKKKVESLWGGDRNYVFFALSENGDSKSVFEKLYSFFRVLKSCYEDIDKYNRIGFLLNSKECLDQYELLTSLSTVDLNERIKNLVGETSNFNNLNYYDNHDILENILLLFNLTFYKDKRFDFKTLYEVRRDSGWTLDHIHAKNEALLNEESLKALEEQLDDKGLVEKAKEKFPLKEQQWEYQNLLYDLRDKAQKFNNEKNDFEIVETSLEEWIHSIGNLVLLEIKQNSKFNNASLEEKLKILAAFKDSEESRKLLFDGTLHAYGLAEERKLWLKNEQDKYFEDIKNRINAFFNERIGEISMDETFKVDFSSGEVKDYGRTVSESVFRNGEPLSLPDILEKCEIVIPDFQREYAQGRCDRNSEFVREMFLDDIFAFLKDEKRERMELDFIYGRINDKNEFFPFDGQQRLTTLFLIYTELCKDKYSDMLSRFHYSDRPEAEEYCTNIISGKGIETNSNNASVKGMQTMRMAIRERLKNKPLSEKEIDKLDSIVFYIPSDISLSTDIYWKMNSRGKRLTPLERFKSSWFDKEEAEKAKNIDKIAVKFFNANEDRYEEVFMGLISTMFSAFNLIENGNEDKTDFYNAELVPSSAYLAFRTLHNGEYKDSLNSLLDAMSDEDFDLEEFKNFFVDACPVYTKKLGIYECIANNQKENSLLFSYLLTVRKDEKQSEEKKNWMRFCANIIWNANNAESALSLIFKLRSKAGDILSYLSSSVSEKDSNLIQYAEEIKKAKAIKNNIVRKEDIKEAIEKAESTAFADGRIDFLFMNEKGEEDWDNFHKRLNNFDSWFDEKGVRKDFRVSVAKAYIKLSPLRWGQNYFFDASRNYWRTEIFAKANTADNRCFVSRLLSATDEDVLNEIEIEETDGFFLAVKSSLVENDWFIKWMFQLEDGAKYSLKWPNGHPCFHKYHCNNVIYWDAKKCNISDQGIIEDKLNTHFFDEMNMHPDDGYYSLIDADGNSHLVILGEWYSGVNYTRFKYKNKTYYLISTGKIITSDEYYNNEWNKVGEERSIYCINGNRKSLKSKKELSAMLSSIPAK